MELKYKSHNVNHWQYNRTHFLTKYYFEESIHFGTGDRRQSNHDEYWCVDGKFTIPNEIFREWCKENEIDLENITEQDVVLMRMKWKS